MSLFNWNRDSEDWWMPEIEISSPELLHKISKNDCFPEMIECSMQLKLEFVERSGMVTLISGQKHEPKNLYEKNKAVKKLDFQFIPDGIFYENKGVRRRVEPQDVRISLEEISWEYNLIPQEGLTVEIVEQSNSAAFQWGGLFEQDYLLVRQIELYIDASKNTQPQSIHPTVSQRIKSGAITLPIELTLYEYHSVQSFEEKNRDDLKKIEKKEYVSYDCGYFQEDIKDLIWVKFRPKPS